MMSKAVNMIKKLQITVWNKLLKEKRDINVYHHSDRSAHIISSSSSITRGVKTGGEEDYLHLSVERGPGYLKNHCILDLPSFMDFRFSLTSAKEVIVTHSGERMLLNVPPGPPVWELKMIAPEQIPGEKFLTGAQVTIGDEEKK